jgi:hypothetical protein
MNIKINKLTGKSAELLTTEIMYCLASAKSLGQDLIKFYIECNEGEAEKRFAAVGKILKSTKKSGFIQLFAPSFDFDKSSTEIEYLKNKYPELMNEASGEAFYLVKL